MTYQQVWLRRLSVAIAKQEATAALMRVPLITRQAAMSVQVFGEGEGGESGGAGYAGVRVAAPGRSEWLLRQTAAALLAVAGSAAFLCRRRKPTCQPAALGNWQMSSHHEAGGGAAGVRCVERVPSRTTPEAWSHVCLTLQATTRCGQDQR